ncbi:MAG: DUF4845 domain-containing protein [Pseudomonadota bacterium]
MNKQAACTRHQQQGMTTLGLIILVAFIAMFVYAGLRLFPVYMEDMKIKGAFASLEDELSGTDFSRRDVQNGLEKRFDIESVRVISFRDVEFTKTSSGYDISVSYTNKVGYMANVSFAVDFKHQASIVR